MKLLNNMNHPIIMKKERFWCIIYIRFIFKLCHQSFSFWTRCLLYSPRHWTLYTSFIYLLANNFMNKNFCTKLIFVLAHEYRSFCWKIKIMSISHISKRYKHETWERNFRLSSNLFNEYSSNVKWFDRNQSI